MQDSSTDISEQQVSQTRALFGFARELGRVRRENVVRLDKHPWSLRLADVDDALPGVKKWRPGARDARLLLSVRQQDLPRCPEPPEEIRALLGAGWEAPGWKPGSQLRKLDPAQEAAFSGWLEKRVGWLRDCEPASRSLDLFQALYEKFRFIEGGNLRYIAKAGSVSFATEKRLGSAWHPLLTRPVVFQLDVEEGRPVISVLVDDAEPARFESELLSAFQDEGLRLELCQTVREDVERSNPHPFDAGAALPAFQRLAATISAESRWAGEPSEVRFDGRCRFAFFEDPVIWIEERASGMAEASDRVIRRIAEGAEIPHHLIDLICGAPESPADAAGRREEETFEARLACAGGEDEEILFAKPANREQLLVAREIRKRDAVLVMGPPGTGKTHTIANLIGDLLAQGQTVLVSSQKEKALRVLKSMLPEPMRDLCVSLTSDQEDVLATVQRLTSRLALVRPAELARKLEAQQDSRRRLIEEIARARRTLFEALCKEFRPVRMEGAEWTPSSLGKWLKAREDLKRVIPDAELSASAFPLEDDELQELYALSKALPPAGAGALPENFPKKESFPEPLELVHIRGEIEDLEGFLARCGIRIAQMDGPEAGAGIRFSAQGVAIDASGKEGESLATLSGWLERDRSVGEPDPWIIAARGAGAAGGATSQRWRKLAEEISQAAALAEREIGQMDELPVEIVPQADRAQLREALAYFIENHIAGEPGFLTKLTQKTRLAALAQARVAGHAPRADLEYEAVLLHLDIEERRDSLRKLWEGLIEEAGGPSFDSLGDDHPEEQAKLRYAPRLEKALGWWSEWASPLLKQMREIGVNPDALAGGTGAGPLESCEALSKNIERFLRPAVEADRARIRLLTLEKQLSAARQAVLEADRESPAAAALADAILAGLDGDQERYEKAWGQMSARDLSRPRMARRAELLAKVEAVAPQWAQAMAQKRPGAFPENAREAWVWRQLDIRFQNYLKTDFGEMQRRIARLSDRLRAETLQLATGRAWLSLALRLQENRALMQKLQGWAQIAAKIGRGTGRGAEVLKMQARELISECSRAVPCWIMPSEKALSTFDASWRFDTVIIDEASQSDIASMPILFLGRKAVIAGDDRQVSPAAVGVGDSAVIALSRQYIQDKVANWPIYQAQASLYDLARTVYSPQMLREHFRCVPRIIGYSNELSYGGSILPLRDAASTKLQPAIVTRQVAGVREANDTNRAEAEEVVSSMKACLARPEYRGKTFGVIVMRSGRTGAQIQLINDLLFTELGPKVIEERKILCGLSPDFQGDERDVIFLSLVDSPDGAKPLRRETAGSDDGMRKRWNVAVSRAKDQVWAVYSFDPAAQLQEGDIRKTFFDYLAEVGSGAGKFDLEVAPELPEFAEDVAAALEKRGYTVTRNYQAGAFTLPLVVEGEGKKAALECDGELARPDEEPVVEEMERQAILERSGWKFVHVRGGEWYRDPEAAVWWLVSDLENSGVKASGEKHPEPQAKSEEKPAQPAEADKESAPAKPEVSEAVAQPAAQAVPAVKPEVKPAVAVAAAVPSAPKAAPRSSAARTRREQILEELMRLGAQVSNEVKKGVRK